MSQAVTMSNPIQQWFKRKMSTGFRQLRGLTTVGYEWNTVLGPRSEYAKVVLKITSNEEFKFVSRVTWPGESYDTWVLDGIIDALISTDHEPMLLAQFELIEIGWHDIDSNAIAYYRAAKIAVQSVFNRAI